MRLNPLGFSNVCEILNRVFLLVSVVLAFASGIEAPSGRSPEVLVRLSRRTIGDPGKLRIFAEVNQEAAGNLRSLKPLEITNAL
jgi:hypothetical protein